jgi:hypothetical protein
MARRTRDRITGAAAALALLLSGAPAAAIPAPAPTPFGLEKAGWTLITASEDTYVYMRPAQPTASGVRRVWTAYDSDSSRDRQGFSFRSVESLSEFDCRKNLTRVVEELFHAGPGLTGPTWRMPNFIPTDWAVPAPGSVGAIRMAFACKTLADA